MTKPIPILDINPYAPSAVVDGNDYTEAEKGYLGGFEATIQNGIGTFIEVAQALACIQSFNLFRHYGTFEAYCRERWEFGSSYTKRLLDAATVCEILPSGKHAVRPTNERQVRALTLLEDPDVVRKAWQLSVKMAGSKPVTGKIVGIAVKKLITEEGAVRKTSERKIAKKKSSNLGKSKKISDSIVKLLGTIRRLTSETPNGAKVAKTIEQIEALLA